MLVLASVIPAMVIVAALLVYGYQRDRERLQRDSIATARAMIHAVDRELVSITIAAQVLGTSPHLANEDFKEFHAQAREVVGAHIGMNVVLSDATGQQLLNTLRPYGAELPPHGNINQLNEVFRAGRVVISDLYVGGVLRQPLMSVDVPIYREGRIVYDLSIGDLPRRFLALLNEQRLPPEWIGAVFDTRGTVVARTQEHERFVGAQGAPALVARMREVQEGAVETVTLEGIPVVSVFSRSTATGWTVALGIPRRNLAAQALLAVQVAAGAAVVMLALGLALAWRLGGRIAHSIHSLQAPASRIGLREPIELPPLGLREADEVGEALVRASRLIAHAEHRAQHDALTGLANRDLFLEHAKKHVELCRREATPLSMLFIDLDGFKAINDRHGHDVGDRLLCAVAERLTGAVRGSDVAARLGGDEFALLLVHADRDAAETVAAKLVESLSAPYSVPPHAMEISASIGVADFPGAGATAEEVMKRADEAMYRAKQSGKRGYHAA
ncbi:MAG TPA: sensor domain-containing diguanylate cyclase [Burkholderiales bacterium]|nr:sensor domain-containing diguanylate cyclase [Burkholderiales bacterium]